MAITDGSGKYLAVNDAACEHYGYTREEFLAMTIRDIRPPEDVPALLENLDKPDWIENAELTAQLRAVVEPLAASGRRRVPAAVPAATGR